MLATSRPATAARSHSLLPLPVVPETSRCACSVSARSANCSRPSRSIADRHLRAARQTIPGEELTPHLPEHVLAVRPLQVDDHPSFGHIDDRRLGQAEANLYFVNAAADSGELDRRGRARSETAETWDRRSARRLLDPTRRRPSDGSLRPICTGNAVIARRRASRHHDKQLVQGARGHRRRAAGAELIFLRNPGSDSIFAPEHPARQDGGRICLED